MVRSIWKRTLVASLAWASFGMAQQPATYSSRQNPPTAEATSTERIITLQETGKPGRKCRVLKTWQTSDRVTAYQVQALDTGEVMTVVESGPVTSVAGTKPGTRVHAVATRIYHWSQSNTPPAEAPVQPGEVVQKVSAPAISPGLTIVPAPTMEPAPTIVSAPTIQPAPSTTWIAPQQVSEPRTGLLTKIFGKSRSPEVIIAADGSGACQPYQPCDVQPARVVATASPYGTVASCDPCCDPAAKKVVTEHKVTILPALRLAKDTANATESKSIDAQTAVESSKKVSARDSNDWRKSWGKADDHYSTLADNSAKSKPVEDKPPKISSPETKQVVEHLQDDIQKSDPLQAPEKYISSSVGEKAKFAKAESPRADDKSKTMYGWGSEQADAKSQRAPLGAQSVVGAGDGMDGQVRYVPVPIVTVPNLSRPPMPPLYAPQPFAQANNAMPNAGAQVSKALGPNMTTTDEGMVNAFTTMPSREAVAQATNAFTGEQAGNSAAASMMPMGMQGVDPRSPYGMVAQAGPVMPSQASMSQGIMPVGYQMPMPANVMPANAGYAKQQMMSVLHDSLYPSQREWAAEGLATFDWHTHPEVVQALLTATREDPAATVRAACVRNLAKMNVNTMPVVAAVHKLKADPDPRVRQEVDQALMVLNPGQNPPSGMRPPIKSY